MQPSNYIEMDTWLNNFSRQAWRPILGSYAAGGNKCVIDYLRRSYTVNVVKWGEKDLWHYFACRKWSDFLSTAERINA